MHKKKSLRFYTSMHSGELELTKLTCTWLEDNRISHQGDLTTMLPHHVRLIPYSIFLYERFFVISPEKIVRGCSFVRLCLLIVPGGRREDTRDHGMPLLSRRSLRVKVLAS